MPVLEKFQGIVLRLMYDRTLGARLHAFYEGAELVVAMHPLRVLQGEVPPWVKEWVLHWARDHMNDVDRWTPTAFGQSRVNWAYSGRY